ncbi:BtaA family protein [Yoonia sp. GPGPB17]|uniref:BtaA family protein n=1 Tax=Yoonia sp. GPGPB17 TaxID=3026147 RepID=UPI0030C11AF2
MTSVTEQLSAAVNQNATMTREGLLERAFSRLFHGLVYAQIWEDPVVDMEALQIQPDDNLVCITSGGCNVLSYLAANPASITAVDLSPAHVMLNKLKLATVQHAPDYATLFAMLVRGDQPTNVLNFDTYAAPFLDAETHRFWNAHTLTGPRKRILARGLYRHGLLGRFIGVVHVIAKLARVDFAPLLAAQSLAEQQAFYEQQIVPLYNSRIIKFLANRRASLFGLGIPPAQYDKLAADAGGDIVAVLQERTRKLFCDFPIKDNYFAWQAAYRGYEPVPRPAVPPI